jgi:hypothetical protein
VPDRRSAALIRHPSDFSANRLNTGYPLDLSTHFALRFPLFLIFEK